MDTVTTSIGRVALSSPNSEAPSQGPTIEDVTSHVSRHLADNCHWVDNQLFLPTEQTNIPNYCY